MELDETPTVTPETDPKELAKWSRKAEYREISDPIFFQWQRGEKTEQDWLDAVTAINDKYPYPTK